MLIFVESLQRAPQKKHRAPWLLLWVSLVMSRPADIKYASGFALSVTYYKIDVQLTFQCISVVYVINS